MTDLRKLAAEMRAYAFAHPMKHALAGTKISIGPIGSYARVIDLYGVCIRVQFTFLRLRVLRVAHLACCEAGAGRDLPQEIVDEIIAAFFHPADTVKHLARGERREMYAGLGWQRDVTGHTDQYIAMDPKQ